MAAMEFIEFESLEELKKYCAQKNLHLRGKDGYAIIADVLDNNNVHWGYVSKEPKSYKCKNPNTKYVLVWE